MGIFDNLAAKAKGLAGKHHDQIDAGLEKAGGVADEKTGGKYSERIDQAVDSAQDAAQRLAAESDGT